MLFGLLSTHKWIFRSLKPELSEKLNPICCMYTGNQCLFGLYLLFDIFYIQCLFMWLYLTKQNQKNGGHILHIMLGLTSLAGHFKSVLINARVFSRSIQDQRCMMVLQKRLLLLTLYLSLIFRSNSFGVNTFDSSFFQASDWPV